jgi:hypothetical protein
MNKLATFAAALVVLGPAPSRAEGAPHYTLEDGRIVVDSGDFHAAVPVNCDAAFALAPHEGRLHVACGAQGIAVYSLRDPLHPTFSTRVFATGTCEAIAPNGWCADAPNDVPIVHAEERADDRTTDAVASALQAMYRAQPTLESALESPQTRKGWTVNNSLALIGGAALGAYYAVSVALVFGTTTCTPDFIFPSCHSFSGWLLIPVAGPIVALADNVGKPFLMNGEIACYAIGTAVNIAALVTLLAAAVYRPGSDHPTARRWTLVGCNDGSLRRRRALLMGSLHRVKSRRGRYRALGFPTTNVAPTVGDGGMGSLTVPFMVA